MIVFGATPAWRNLLLAMLLAVSGANPATAATAATTATTGKTTAAPAGADRWQALAVPMFEHIGLEQGLPHPIGMALAQDGDGYLWVGTQSGLARWDGYRMRAFSHNPADPASLPGDFIQALHADRQGRLWIGSATGGLALYDRATERFSHPAAALAKGSVSAMASDAAGGLWVASAGGLDYLDTAKGTLRHADGPPRRISALLVDRDGNLWIGSSQGLERRDAASGVIAPVTVAGSDGKHDTGAAWRDSVMSLAQSSTGQIAFGTLKSGIGLVDAGARTGRIVAVPGVPDLAANMILAITESEPGHWWASTYGGGVVEIDAKTGHGRRILHQPAVAASLSSDRAAALLRDRSGLLWTTTELGVDLYDPQNDAVDLVFGAADTLEASVSAVMSDSGGRVWLALADQGIDLVEPDGSRIAALRPDPARPDNALPKRVVTALAEAPGREAWIGTQLGLYRSSAGGKQVQRIALPQLDAYPRVGAILPRGDELWLGTFDGLLRYNPATGALKRYAQGAAAAGGLTDNRIHALLADGDGTLWIATRNGLNRLDPDTDTVEQVLAAPADPGALSEAVISSLALDGRGRLWVGTYGGGVCVMDSRDRNGTPRFHRVGLADGLPSASITALLAVVGSGGQVWASSSDGVAMIDPATYRVRALGRADGLALHTFFVNSAAITPEHDLLFGATTGLAVLHPQRLSNWGFEPPLVLSAMRVDGKALTPAALTQGHLQLQPWQRGFEVDLAALDFSAPRRNRYTYRLDGYDSHWIEADASRRAIGYNNLSPGHYLLRMRGSNREGMWNTDELRLAVDVLPAWHQTWWAKAGYLLAAGALAWSLYHWRVRSLRRRGDQLQELVYSRTLHLERLNAIVRAINEQPDFDALLQAILQQSTAIAGIDSALALVREKGAAGHSDDDMLVLRAAWGRLDAAEPYRLTLRQAEARYAQSAGLIAPDVYALAFPDAGIAEPRALLAVRISIEGQVEGYLVYESYQALPNFLDSDLDLVKALKEPFVSAFQKARALRQIEQARARAEAATLAKSEFLANISHEIRTPMNAILGFAGLGTHLELPPQPLDYFRKIGRAGQSLLEIINDVLDFSKIESGRLELETVLFDLPDLLGQIADLFSWRAAERGLELVIWAAPEVPATLLGDPLRLSQVLVNLVGNALKFTSAGHIQLCVELDRTLDGAVVLPAADAAPDAGLVQDQMVQRIGLRFTVQDTGLGISAEQQTRLFQAFAQADTSTTRLYGGTGLGLAISQQLVGKMGGSISVDSRQGAGSSFGFSIGLQAPVRQTPRLLQVPGAALGKHVLVVDDSEPVRNMLKQQLRALGLEASAVKSGEAALWALRQQPYDLLLVDAAMPDMDGAGTLELVRTDADARIAALPAVIMVTAHAREHDATAARLARTLPFIDKPAHPQMLRMALLSAFGIAPDVVPALPVRLPSAAMQRIRGARVLVVDDNPVNQQVAAEVLARAGVIVDLAASGIEALAMTQAADYDAVLMDIQMPDMDGYQATAQIRAAGRQARLPVIAMTAHAVTGYRESCLARGMNDYVTKPIEPDTLYQVLAEWIAGPVAPPQPVTMVDQAGAPGQAGPLKPSQQNQLGLLEQFARLAQPVQPPDRQWPGIDSAAALERLGGQHVVLERLLDLFVQNFDANMQQIRMAVDQRDLPRALDMLHKIRGAAGNLSATELYHAAGTLEQLLAGGHPLPAEWWQPFGTALDLVLASARDYVRYWRTQRQAQTDQALRRQDGGG